MTTVKNESTLRNHLSTHVDKDNRDNGTVELDDKEKEEELKVSELEQKLCESKNVLPHTALDRTRNEASELRNEAVELRTTTDAVIVTCGYCGFISDNVPELKLHKADTHDGLIFQCNQ